MDDQAQKLLDAIKAEIAQCRVCNMWRAPAEREYMPEHCYSHQIIAEALKEIES